MRIKLKHAVKLFFPSSSLELVYFEAITNSLDAYATEIDINIKINSFKDHETLNIAIIDNGKGFIDRNFQKFGELLDVVEDDDHKGLGRLVFLEYFKKIEVDSVYEGNNRAFVYNDSFDGKSKVSKTDKTENRTSFIFSDYRLDKIKSYDYLIPKAIKKKLQQHFYPYFYNLKLTGRELKIKINLTTNEPNQEQGFYNDTQELGLNELPELEVVNLPADGISLYDELQLHFFIKENFEEENVTTAICVDKRTIPVDIFGKDGAPKGYELIFLLYSDLFLGKANSSRQELVLPEGQQRIVKELFTREVSKIIKERIPKINEKNKEIKESLSERFPFLSGYFDDSSAGIIDREKAIEKAQQRFFKDQKDTLDREDFTEEAYEKSIEVSSRILMEYILYRNIIIKKLEETTHKNSESDIHKLIIPERKKIHKSNFMSDIYTNNVWLLDDKYMTFNTILSDKVMSEVIKEITKEEKVEHDNTEADIAIIFSGNPSENEKVDVVIVEIKKRGLDLADNVKAVVQLQQRALKLMKYYPNKIQRIWFYAVVEFNDEFKLWLLNNKYFELFSSDSVYYKEDEIRLELNSPTKCIMGTYVLSLDSLLHDARNRNSTFLRILKEGFSHRYNS